MALIDVQAAFISTENRPIVGNILKLIKSMSYDLYIEAVFSAEKGSIWDKQMGWTLPASSRTSSVAEIKEALKERIPRIFIHKHTKSIFGDPHCLARQLRSSDIEEVHLVGFDINDCVLASAMASFDSGFYTYVIEDCCGASSGRKLAQSGVFVLRHLHMTNHSVSEQTKFAHL